MSTNFNYANNICQKWHWEFTAMDIVTFISSMWSISNLFNLFDLKYETRSSCLAYYIAWNTESSAKELEDEFLKTTISNCDCIQSYEMSKVLQGTNLSHQNVRQRSTANLALGFFFTWIYQPYLWHFETLIASSLLFRESKQSCMEFNGLSLQSGSCVWFCKVISQQVDGLRGKGS